MSEVVAGLDCARFRRHALHDLERDWPETNCYVDLWIELLSARGQEPLAGLGFTCLIDFEGDQFTFFKPPVQDLKLLYGADILELAIYDDVVDHCAEQVARGRLPMIELDAYYMPDTKGLTYRTEHSKTTIGINAIDGEARRVAYFHNAGYFVAEGEDFDGLFRRLPEQQGRADVLFPYCELVKFSAAPCLAGVPALARALLDGHLAARPRQNPVRAFAARFPEHAGKLASRSEAFFHKYTFNVLRQLGSNFELLASHLDWLAVHELLDAPQAVLHAREISQAAKACQFQLARAVMRRQPIAAEPIIARMGVAYDRLFDSLDAVAGRSSAAAIRAPIVADTCHA